MKADRGHGGRFSGFLRRRREIARHAAMEAARKRGSLEGLAPLFRKYHISRAFLFGSIRAGSCRKDSDIDLYVEGVDPESYWDLWREIEQHSGQTVDLYCDRDDPRFVQRVRERGELIYEA